MIYFCCNNRRRSAVLEHGTLNGIDFLDVLDGLELSKTERQRTLFLHFLKPIGNNTLNVGNIRIEGGDRIKNITAEEAPAGTGQSANVLTVKVNSAGDFSTYRLRLVKSSNDLTVPDNFDPILSEIEFSFKVECPTDFDCKEHSVCPPEPKREPEIDYLARDYDGFRGLMLDRLSALMPAWRERNPADLGVALIEALAYVGDYLSYQQDAVATEAYLGTARKRISVRRHARLVDYQMHDGSNSRVWVQIRVSADIVEVPKSTRLITRVAGYGPRIPPDSRAYFEALNSRPEVFETMHEAKLFSGNNDFSFYTWGATECCLPKGATRATLVGHHPHLEPGQVLIFEETCGPLSGDPKNADPAHRHAVRLTEVNRLRDPLGGRFASPSNNDAVQITAIEWAAEDALPFALCISSRTDSEHGDKPIGNVTVARGNIVLADHGLTIRDESLGSVPESNLLRVTGQAAVHCEPVERKQAPVRFRPRLAGGPLTQVATVAKIDALKGQTSRVAFDAEGPAVSAFTWDQREAQPAVTLNHGEWEPVRDLLSSDKFAREFVPEVDDEGATWIRFGDDQHGLRPAGGTEFSATYRVGNGPGGNVGAESIVHIISDDSRIDGVRNPMQARGGTEGETNEHVRQSAPHAFRRQERAVTPADYAEVTERRGDVQRAAATFRWTGSWRTVFVTVDRAGGFGVDEEFERDTRRHLDRFRMAGHDLEIDGPHFVSLEIEMAVCVKPPYFRSAVKKALLELFSNRVLPDGSRGVFHPDNFTFGEPVYLSPLYAAAQSVAGVDTVNITMFQRQGIADSGPRETGKMVLGR
ncbi:MAG TPA: putative baseplate assembly protein, partial [Blastocatellia bacterium]|nr:putative baseplate assembly protein [Blastocatellia bacterium]